MFGVLLRACCTGGTSVVAKARGIAARHDGGLIDVGQYLPVLALVVLAVALRRASSRVASRLLAPEPPHRAKRAPYECGIVPGREPPERFPVRFYLVAMIFIVFDIEIIFLYPWAVIYRDLGAFGLVAMLVFAVAVFVSFVYLIANGALDWGPVKQRARGRIADGVAPSAPTARPRSAGSGSRVGGTSRRGGLMQWPEDIEQGPRGPRPQLPHRQARGPREVGPAHVGHARPRSAWPAAPSR